MIFRRTLQDQMVAWVFIGSLHIGEEKIYKLFIFAFKVQEGTKY